MLQFQESFNFVNDHPAFLSPYCSAIDHIMVMKVCKNGYSLNNSPKTINIYKDHPRFLEFVNDTEEDSKRYGYNDDFTENKNDLLSIEIDYEKFYGYKWRFAYIEVWIEGGATRFLSKDEHTGKERWESWHDIDLDCSGRTYEEAVIKYAQLVKDRYGDFSCWGENDIVPKFVRDYNKGKEPFSFSDSKTKGFKNIDFNDDYLSIKDEEENEIWWQIWGKKNLPDMFDIKSETIDVSHYLDEKEFRKKYPY